MKKPSEEGLIVTVILTDYGLQTTLPLPTTMIPVEPDCAET